VALPAQGFPELEYRGDLCSYLAAGWAAAAGHDALRDQVRQQAGKAPEPTAAIIGAADACPLGGVKIQPNRNKRAHIPS